jgi:hypothetical protein
MADLKLSITTDFEKASKAFQELANSSEATREKMEKFSDSFQTEKVDKFIDKQKLLEISLTGTRGEVAAMTTAHNNYEKEIERLIRSGLDPESEAIKKLRDEHDKLEDKIKETNEVQKAQADLMKGAEKAALGFFAALGAGVAAVGIATQKTAEMGDEYAKTARIIGMTAETFQELDYAAKMSGIDNLSNSLEKLNKSVADVKSGTGSLTNYLKENDRQLLSQLQNVNSNEEAFNLLMDAINRAPDEFSRAELATAAFGKSGQDLILMANEGAEGISKLREEARKYGVISNEAAGNSEEFLDAQSRLKAAVSGVTSELTAKLLPGLTDIITKIAEFISGIDNWDEILDTVTYTLAGLTAGITTFLIVTKGAAVVNAFTTAIKGLNAAIASNPIGAIAVVVTSVLIPALIALYKNWDNISTYLQQGLARIQYAFKWLGSVIQEGLTVAFNAVKIAAISLVDFIYGNIIRAVGNMLELLGKLPFVGELFQAASEKVSSLGNAIGNLAEETRRSSAEAIQAAHDKQDATEAELNTTLAAIDTEARARRAAIDELKKGNEEIVENETTTQEELSEIESDAATESLETEAEKNEALLELKQKHDASIIDEEKKYTASLTEILNQIPLTKQQIQTQEMEQFTRFLQQRWDLEQTDGLNRIAWLLQQQEEIMSMENLTGEQRIALEKSVNEMILAEDAKLKEAQEELQKQKLDSLKTFYGGIKDLSEEAGKQNRALAVFDKIVASAEAGINSALAFTKALASGVPPFNYIAAAGVLAAGIAQQTKIINTVIPSAETGGRFIVPNSTGSDTALMRVNQGEEIDITPRGMTGGGIQNIIVQIEKETIFNVVNNGIRSGDILIQAFNY